MSLKSTFLFISSFSLLFVGTLIVNATLSPLSPPPIGGYDSGSNSILDPGCAPETPDCWVNLSLGGSGWSLTGNSGTTVGTNFIGTTDAQDFMIKTNGTTIAIFGQIGNISFGNYTDNFFNGEPDYNGNLSVTASGIGSMAWGGSLGGYNFPVASGVLSTAWGVSTQATSWFATAWGDRTSATEENATAFGTNTLASGTDSTAWGEWTIANNGLATAFGTETIASGRGSTAWGFYSKAESFFETSFGIYPTQHIGAVSQNSFNASNRLMVIGNGMGNDLESDAFTILKNGQTGIAIDNFETNTNGNIFQLGDGSTNIIGYVDDSTGNWVAVSDERKKTNITDITYGLEQLIQLRPIKFTYTRNNQSSIGFIAQQVLPIIPESVSGTESEGYGMSYATLTPVIVKAVQELNLKIDMIQLASEITSSSIFDLLINWFGDIGNGVQKIFAKEIITEKLCVGDICITESELENLLSGENSIILQQSTSISEPVKETSDIVNNNISEQEELTIEQPLNEILEINQNNE